MARPDNIPLELLQTFIRIADLDGDATTAAHDLEISQPTISKRLSALRKLTSDPNRQPWLILKGKRWKLTSEGQRVRGVVSDLVQRYERMQQFITGQQESHPVISIACGQQAASGFAKAAIERFLKQHGDCKVRLSTPRGKARIEGVAGGQFDMAIVTDSPATIHGTAQMELYIVTLFDDRSVLVANPPSRAEWADQWHSLPTSRPVAARELIGLPFILPETEASRRRQFDEWTYAASGQLPDVVLEAGGWKTILDFASAGLGVGLVSESSLASLDGLQKKKLTPRTLDPNDFPADAVRLIARKAHGVESPDLTPLAHELATLLMPDGSRENAEGVA